MVLQTCADKAVSGQSISLTVRARMQPFLQPETDVRYGPKADMLRVGPLCQIKASLTQSLSANNKQ